MDDEDDDGNNQAAERIRGPGTDVIESGDVGVLFLEQLDKTSDPSERTDFTNFRNLLWRTMAQIPDRVEPRSRELSPLLLRFIRCVGRTKVELCTQANEVPDKNLFFVVCVYGSNEFYPADLLVAPTQNFLKRICSSDQEMVEDDDAELEDEENEDDSKHSKRKVPRRAAAK